MAKTIQTDENGDFLLGTNNSWNYISDLEATEQISTSRAKTQKGEMVLDVTNGVAYFDAAFDDVQPEEFRESLIKNLKLAPDIEEVPVVEVEQIGSTFKWRAILQTTFGVGTIDG